MAAKQRPLLYLETSVFGFCYDIEPRDALRRESALALFDQVRLGILNAVTSAVTFAELSQSAEPLRARLLALLEPIRLLEVDEAEAARLAVLYLSELVIPREHVNDARHAAFATVGRADVVVSLNLRHLANEWAERRISAVNLREGYHLLHIRTPEEVLSYED